MSQVLLQFLGHITEPNKDAYHGTYIPGEETDTNNTLYVGIFLSSSRAMHHNAASTALPATVVGMAQTV